MPRGGFGSFSPPWNDTSDSVMDPLILEAQGRRMRYVDLVAPAAATDPGALAGITVMAQTITSDEEFQQQINELYGFNEAGQKATELAEQPADLAKIEYDQLPPAMQAAVRRQGFEPVSDYEEHDDDKQSGLFGSIPAIGDLAQDVTGFLGEEVLHPVAEGFNALARASTQLYRTGVAVDEPGSSFLNPADWQAAWTAVGNGQTYLVEKDRDELKEDYDLSDAELDLYLNLSQGKLPGEIAEEEGYAIGTAEHSARVHFLYQQSGSEVGQELIGDPLNGQDGLLNNYRVSFGRFWSRRGGFEAKNLDHGLGMVVSGAGDLTWALAADPTLVVGKAWKAARLGQIALHSFESVDKAVDAAMVARKLREGAWTTRAVTGNGLRVVDIIDETGQNLGGMSKMRLGKGGKGAEALELVRRSFETGEWDELLRTFPQMYHSLPALVEESTKLKYRPGLTGEEYEALRTITGAQPHLGKGFEDIETLENFLRDTDGYRMIAGAKFGGKNTAEFFRLPELGRANRAKATVKGGLGRAQNWANGLDRRLAEDIGWALPKVENPAAVAEGAEAVLDYPGRISHLMRALSPVNEYTLARRAAPVEGLTRGQAAVVRATHGSPLAQTAARGVIAPLRFSQIFTTHVPRAGYVGLWESGDLAEFNRFLDMGKVMGMDARKLARYRDDFIGWELHDPTSGEVIRGALGQSAANRSLVLKAYHDDLLSMFDIDPASDLAKKFLPKVQDQIYGLNEDGTAKVGRALALSQTADAVAIPSLRDMLMATNRYSVMRSMFGRGGVLNPRLIDAAVTRYWKPSVLMRVGFIGRAAGEELLAYLARFGSAHYIGQTIALGEERMKVFDEILEEFSANPTLELIRDYRSRTPEQWRAMLAYNENKTALDPRRLLSFGQSQALAPMTGAIHAGDSFAQKVLLAPWAHNLEKAPTWRLNAARRMRDIDNRAMLTSIRVAKINRKVGELATAGIQRLPGLRTLADGLDATLFPILSRYITDFPTFNKMASEVGINKAYLAKMLMDIDDDGWQALNEMLTDPVVARAHLEEVASGNTMNLGHELGVGRRSEDELQTVIEKDQFGRETERVVTAEGNVHVRSERPDGVTNMQHHANFDMHAIERLRHLMDPKTKLGRIAVRTFSQHFPETTLRRLGQSFRATGAAFGTQADEIVQVRNFITQLQSLPSEHRALLREAVENGDVDVVARELMERIDDTAGLVELELQHKALEVLADVPPELHRKVLNPMVVPDEIVDDWDAAVETLRKAYKARFGTPGMQRLLYGWEGWHERLAHPPRQGYLRAYAIAGDKTTSRWGLQHLTADTPQGQAVKEKFVESLVPRLEEKGLPDLSEQIADELFDPMFPAYQVLQDLEAAGLDRSVPISYMASSNPDLADEVVLALQDVTDKSFHLQALDVPQTSLQGRFAAGTHGKILDGQPDWEESILWRVQGEDFTGAQPLPIGSRRVLVQGPRDPNLPPLPPVYDTSFGPPEPFLAETDLRPTTSRWESELPGEQHHVEDIIDALPDSPEGTRRIYGWRPALDPDAPIRWSLNDPDVILTLELDGTDSMAWHFADVRTADFEAMANMQTEVGEALDDTDFINQVMNQGGYDQHHFATDFQEIEEVDDYGEFVGGFQTTPESFEFTELVPQETWRPGYSPQYFVQEHEDALRRLANINTHPIDPAEMTAELEEVARRLGLTDVYNLSDEVGSQTAAIRINLAHRADNMLTEGRRTGALPDPEWWDEDALKAVADGIGQWTPESLTRLHDQALARIAETSDELLPVGITPDDLPAMRDRLLASRDMPFDPTGPLYPGDPVIEIRRAVVDDLDQLVPGWRGSEGWDRVGTGNLFGIDTWEPTAIEGGAKKHYSVGLSPDEKTGEFIDAQVEEALRQLTTARSENGLDVRGLDEYLYPLALDPSPTRVNQELVQQAAMRDRPAANYGRKYVTAKHYGWDSVTNWFFDDVAAQGISSIVRNQLFATNYMKAHKLNKGLGDALIDPKLRAAVEADVKEVFDMDADDLDELIRLGFHGVVEIPYTNVKPWYEQLSHLDESGHAVKETVQHDNVLEMTVEEQQIEAVTLAENSVMRPPAPSMTHDQANRAIKAELGIHDTPLVQHIKDLQRPIAKEISTEMGKVAKAARRQGLDDEGVDLAVETWWLHNKAPYELRLTEAMETASTEMRSWRNLPEQFQTDPSRMIGYQPPLPPAGPKPEVGELMDMLTIPHGERAFFDLVHGGEQRVRDITKNLYATTWEGLTDAQRRKVVGAARREIGAPPADVRPGFNVDDNGNFVVTGDLSGQQLARLRMYYNQRLNALETVRDANIARAMEGTIPFIDDHRIRSQFQEYVGNLVPFWFAEEQFLKRWTRIMKESPEAFRKGQLVMHGLKVIGAVHTDPITGREYYIYPGSAAATEIFTGTVGKVIFGSEAALPQGLSLTGDVAYTLPGFGDQMGVPSAGPVVGIATEMMADHSPEWAQVQEAVMGGRGSNRELMSYIVPTTLSRFYSAFTSDMDETQLQSGIIETTQIMAAAGHGLDEDATPQQRQEYIDQVEANARSVQLLRAISGVVTLSSPSVEIAEELPLSNEFASLRNSGIPYSEALMLFMERHGPDASPYTVFKTENVAGAPLAATQEALEATDAYAREISQFPLAAPWLLLPFQSPEGDDEFVNRAYRQQIRMGLRKYRTHEEYIDALAWADASPKYFEQTEEYDSLIEQARMLEDDAMVSQLTQEKAFFSQAYRNSHPIFADKLLSSEGRQERTQILRESFLLIDHPSVQDAARIGPDAGDADPLPRLRRRPLRAQQGSGQGHPGLQGRADPRVPRVAGPLPDGPPRAGLLL